MTDKQKLYAGNVAAKVQYNFKDLTGQRFGRLTVLHRVENDKSGKARWSCQCDCGNTMTENSGNLNSKHSVSCGCFRNELCTILATTHGHCRPWTSTYRSWASMLRRSLNRYGDHPSYTDVAVCDRWNPEAGGSFENFLFDMGERPEGTTLGRFGDVGNYCKENCAWQTKREQTETAIFKQAAMAEQESAYAG